MIFFFSPRWCASENCFVSLSSESSHDLFHWRVFGQRQNKMDVTAAWGDKELLSAASALCKDRTRRRFSGMPQLIGLQSDSLLRVGIKANKINKQNICKKKRERREYLSPFGDVVVCGLWRGKHNLIWTLAGYLHRNSPLCGVQAHFLIKSKT